MKNKLLKRAVVCVAAASLLMSAGCGKKEEQTRQVGDFTFKQDELQFTWYNNSDTAAATRWADTSILEKWITDNLKVSVTYMDPGGASAEKLATMIVSDEFPDVMTMSKGQDVQKLIKAKKVVPLNEYMEKYTNLSGDFETSRALELFRQEDGNIYEIPNWANAAGNANGNNAWAINQKVYEDLGSPKLESFDDLYVFLKQVKEKYPDMIPYETTDVFQGERYVLAGMAEELPPDHLDFYAYPQDGKLVSIFEHPAYRETWLFLNKLYREKLMTQDPFSQTSDQVKEKYRNNKVAVTSAALNMYDSSRTDMIQHGTDWITIVPLMKEGLDRSKVYSQGFDRSGWTEFVITKDAANPEGIYAYIDWLYSPEGQRLFSYGPMGTYYDEVTEEGYPILNEKWFNTKNPMKELKGNGSGSQIGNTSFIDSCGIFVDNNSPEERKSWGKKQQLSHIWPYAKDVTEYANITPVPGTEEGTIFQKITDLHKEARAKMLFAASSDEVEQILDKFIEDTKKAKIDKVLAYEEERWKDNRAKLGLD